MNFNKLQELLHGRKKAYLVSALLSSCVFGLIHFENLIEQSFIGTVMQVYFAFAIGLCFCGVYLFSGTLLIPILLHGIVDTGVFLLAVNNNATATSFNWVHMALSTAILIIGLVYLVEVLSVMIQVTYFKLPHGKRIFRMSPIHHHFEMCGWSEIKIVCVFSAFTAVCGLIALLLVIFGRPAA